MLLDSNKRSFYDFFNCLEFFITCYNLCFLTMCLCVGVFDVRLCVYHVCLCKHAHSHSRCVPINGNLGCLSSPSTLRYGLLFGRCIDAIAFSCLTLQSQTEALRVAMPATTTGFLLKMQTRNLTLRQEALYSLGHLPALSIMAFPASSPAILQLCHLPHF